MDVLDGVVTVSLSLSLRFGKNIMEVSSRVQEKVKAAIENMTGLSVADVNIKVAGVDDDTEKLTPHIVKNKYTMLCVFYARKIAGRQKVQYNEGCRDDTPFFEFRVRRKLSPGEDRKEEIWEDQKSENTFSECYLGGSFIHRRSF